jgi:hemerythrin-like domain-containing protein
MTEPMKQLVNLLIDEHRRLLGLIGEMEGILPPKSTRPPDRTRLRQLLAQFIELLTTHGRLEVTKLFPALEKRLPKADHWQIKMLEIQDEAILSEASHLHEWLQEHPPTASFEARREDSARLIRWTYEHIEFEEGRLFPPLLKAGN